METTRTATSVPRLPRTPGACRVAHQHPQPDLQLRARSPRSGQDRRPSPCATARTATARCCSSTGPTGRASSPAAKNGQFDLN